MLCLSPRSTERLCWVRSLSVLNSNPTLNESLENPADPRERSPAVIAGIIGADGAGAALRTLTPPTPGPGTPAARHRARRRTAGSAAASRRLPA